LGSADKRLEILKEALPSAEDPEPIRRAIAELEANPDRSEE
jgi:hypothetical protein